MHYMPIHAIKLFAWIACVSWLTHDALHRTLRTPFYSRSHNRRRMSSTYVSYVMYYLIKFQTEKEAASAMQDWR